MPSTAQTRTSGTSDATWHGGGGTGSTSSGTASSRGVGFYKGGVWYDRERTEEEKRWLTGGQGPRRQEKRRARMQAWVDGQWLPSWLENYKKEKAEREKRHEAEAEDHRGGRPGDNHHDVHNKDGGGDDEADHTTLLQLNQAGETDASTMETFDDATSFMEQPGVHGGEMAEMINAGVPQGHARRFEQLMRRYRFYVTMELGPEARWALGRWLTVSQWAAGAQDCLEDVVRDRIRDTRHYPLQRAPQNCALREELLLWTSELTELVADVGVAAALAANPGVLQPLPTPATAADYPELRRPPTRSRSRSRSRTRAADGVLGQAHDVPQPEEADTEGDDNSFLSHPPPQLADLDREGEVGDETVLMAYGGYTVAEPSNDEEDRGETRPEGRDSSATGPVEEGETPFPANDPPGLLGPVGAEELDTDVTRMGDLMHEEVEFADRAMLVQQAVRGAMHELPPGSAREVIRRMLFRQDYMMNLQFWLHRALGQALRTCPPGDGPIDWGRARDAEAGIWRRVMGLEDQDPMVRELRATVDARLRSRENHLREVETSLARARPGPYNGGPLPSVAPSTSFGPNTRRNRVADERSGRLGSSTDTWPMDSCPTDEVMGENAADIAPGSTAEHVRDAVHEGDFEFEDRSLDDELDEGMSDGGAPRTPPTGPEEPSHASTDDPTVPAGPAMPVGPGAPSNGSSPGPVRPSLAPHLRPWRPRATPDSPVRDARRRILALLRRRVLPPPRDDPAGDEDGAGGVGSVDLGGDEGAGEIAGGIGPVDVSRRRVDPVERRRVVDARGDAAPGSAPRGDLEE